MESAQSEPVRLKASTEILDRAGVRGGVELDVGVDVTVRSPHEVIKERLARLAAGAQHMIELSKSSQTLSMNDYEHIIGQQGSEEPAKTDEGLDMQMIKMLAGIKR
jgi:hypothetical protein